ncbi:MAG: hypothetical protein IJL87_09520, partial [Clostridia bacterium]|nr:hypothetical protein [Clostridia bacterium]
AHQHNATLLLEVFDGKSASDRVVWTMDAEKDITINGSVEVHVRAKTDDVNKNVLMIGAVLVDTAEQEFPCFDTGSIGVLEQKVVAEKGVVMAENGEAYDLVEWEQRNCNKMIVSYGTMDLRNPEAGYEPATAIKRAEPIKAGEWYDYTIYLQPNYYTVAAGHRLELYIVPFCGFSSDYAAYDSCTAEELAMMGLNPKAMVPFTKDYSFTVDNSSSFGLLPVVN